MNTSSRSKKAQLIPLVSKSNLSQTKDIMKDSTDEDLEIQGKKRRILVLGAPGVGKSAVILRFKDDVFRNEYLPTIQEVYRKDFKFNNERVELEIIDLDGQNEYTIMNSKKHAIGVNAFILVYSVENQYSFSLISSLNSRLSSLVGDNFPKILIGNKSDLNIKRVISTEQGKELAQEINAHFVECSARSGSNIQSVFHSALIEINKFESNIDIKAFTCSSFIRLVIRYQSLFTILTYTLLGLQILASFLILSTGVIITIEYEDKFKQIILGVVFVTSLWSLIFSILGAYAMKTKKKESLNYFFLGTFFSLLLIAIYSVFIYIFFAVVIDIPHNSLVLLNFVIAPILFVMNLAFILLSFAFQKIFDLDLINYYTESE